MKTTTIAFSVFCLAAPAMAASCESLASLTLPQAKIDSARVVAAGAFAPPAGRPDAYRNVPEFCRVAATLTPSSDSDIKVEFWLPTAGWNGKLQVVGNGGWAGVISYGALAAGVRDGYATASTDTGHSTPGGEFAVGHREKLIDFSWRSEHEMTVKAKAMVAAFYGAAPHRSYWNGCSTGGRQALVEAQRFPDDFDGIIAGAPGNRTAMGLWMAHALVKDPAAHIPPAKYPMIHQAALAACDAADGLKDGLISDPQRCRFDPAVLLCKEGDRADCLTAPQVEAARKVYGPARNPRTGRELFETLAPGSELGWAVMGGAQPYGPILDQAKYVVFQDTNWDWRTFDFDKDNDRFERPEYLIMNGTDPHLEKFVAHGGKLLLYHGWADQNVSPYMTVQYFENVRETLGTERTDNSVRLFMEPGMAHCGGGDGPNTFDKIKVLERWVEQGQPPASIEASHSVAGKIDRTRPLCPYPQVAVYKGSGSIDDAANFACGARNAAPPADLPDGLYADIRTSKGEIVARLEADLAPMTVANFVGLAEGTIANSAFDAGRPFFDGTTWHRVVPGHVIQTGIPQSGRARGPGYTFPNEIHAGLSHNHAGALNMANGGPNTNASQFCITLGDRSYLDGDFTVFGDVVRGLDVVMRIVQGDAVEHVGILRVGAKAQAFHPTTESFQAQVRAAEQRVKEHAEQKRVAEQTWIASHYAKATGPAGGVLTGQLTAPRAAASGAPLSVRYHGTELRYMGLVTGRTGPPFEEVAFGSAAGGVPGFVDSPQVFRFEPGSTKINPGLDGVIANMAPGERRIVIVPAASGYGRAGLYTPEVAGRRRFVVSPNALLVYDVEVLSGESK